MELCCSICEEDFIENVLDPLTLPCGHTYCSGCLSKILASSSPLCPEDRSIIPIKSINELPKNFSLLRMLNRGKISTNNAICKDHQKPVEFICMFDKAKVCANCALFGNHRGHKIKTFEEVTVDIAAQTDCLLEMLEIMIHLQETVIGDPIKSRINGLAEKYLQKKNSLEISINESFKLIKKKIMNLEKTTLNKMKLVFEMIESNLVFVRDVPILIDSEAKKWKNEATEKLTKIHKITRDLTLENFEFSEIQMNGLFENGEKILKDLEGIKEIRIEECEDMINSLKVIFQQDLCEKLCTIAFINKIDEENGKEVKETGSPSKLFNQKVFNQALDVIKFKTSSEADFSGAGDLGNLGEKIAAFLPGNTYLKKLKLVKNNISDGSAIKIFQALKNNNTLQVLNISQNNLSNASLDELIELLEINTNLQDIYLLGNPKISSEYKSKISAMCSKIRKIHI